MRFSILISSIASIFSMTTPTFIAKLFQEPQHSTYQFSDMNEMQSTIEWISHKEDSKNIQKDQENLISDMKVSILEYQSTQNG
jgi:hypothetical protein